MATSAAEQNLVEAADVARAHVYRFLAAASADPIGKHFGTALDRHAQAVAIAAADLLASEAPELPELGPGERPAHELDLRPVAAALGRPREDLAREHLALFGLVLGGNAPPCETEYCHSTLTFYRAQQLADIAGFYRAFGLELNREEPERQDHISVELEFLAHLIHKQLFASRAGGENMREKAAICRDAQKKFFEAHLGWWTPAFAERLRRAAPGGFYAALGDALAAFLTNERALFGLPPRWALAQPQSQIERTADGDPCQACQVQAVP